MCSSKDAIDKMKRQSKNWEKIFANQKFDKEFISRTYKNLLELNNKMPSLQTWIKAIEKISQTYKQLESALLTKPREKCIPRHSPAD